MENVLSLQKVNVVYRERNYLKHAVNDLSLDIRAGEIFGFLGPNGAGKTTTIKTILNLIPSFSGKIVLFGGDVRRAQVRERIGYMPEIANYYWYLTPQELLLMYAGLFGIGRKQAREKSRELFALVGLEKESQVLMKYFSKGMLQKVNLAQALINDPELLILDEPTSGLDPVARMKVRDIIRDLKHRGKTIFFSSHELSEAELVCDRVGIINGGRIIKTAELNDVLNRKSHQQSLERYFLEIITGGAH